ncbi:MAG: tetratricopeptide repeat protein [Synechococcales cyanobacterium RM1_1_8]|nr:tetratricopeptide repeat protein [Synechococcales cyanobacterium RM1_1_8]
MPRKRVGVLALEESVEDLYEAVRGFGFAQPPLGSAQSTGVGESTDVLVVRGLKYSLYEYEDLKRLSGWSEAEVLQTSWKGVPKVLVNLNQQRERFRDDFGCFFVFLVPPFIIRYLVRRAPDFFDWRSGVFRFKEDNRLVKEQVQENFVDDFEVAGQLSSSQRIEKIADLRNALEEGSDLDVDQRFQLFQNLGVLFFYEDSRRDAYSSWEKAVQLTPSSSEQLNAKGKLLGILNRYEEAIASYDKAVEIKPDKHEAWYNKACAQALSHQPDLALHHLHQAIQLDPDHYRTLAQTDSDFDSLRQDPRFQQLLAPEGETLN